MTGADDLSLAGLGKQRRGGQQALLEQQQSDELPGNSSDPGRDSHDAFQDNLQGASEQANGPVLRPEKQEVPATAFAEGVRQGSGPAAQELSWQKTDADPSQAKLPRSEGPLLNGVLRDGEGSRNPSQEDSNHQKASAHAAGNAQVASTSDGGAQLNTASRSGRVADGDVPEESSSHGPETLPDGLAGPEGSHAPSDPAQPAERYPDFHFILLCVVRFVCASDLYPASFAKGKACF